MNSPFGTTLQYDRPSPMSRVPKANVSQFGAGLTLDFAYKPHKLIDQRKNNASQIRFEEPTEAEI